MKNFLLTLLGKRQRGYVDAGDPRDYFGSKGWTESRSTHGHYFVDSGISYWRGRILSA